MEKALPEYEKAEAYFEGCVEEVFPSERIRQLVAGTGRYRFNLVKTAVTVLAQRVELVAVTAPAEQAATDVISEVWDANDMDVHYPELFLRTFKYGDAYLMVWPIYEDDPTTTDDDELVLAGVELTVQSPEHCRIIYDPENERRKLFGIKRWKLQTSLGEKWRADLYYSDRIERYLSKVGDVTDAESWDFYLDDGQEPDMWLLDNPYAEIPFFHHRNALPYGRPEHKDGYGCQDGINKSLISMLTTMDSHGWPQRYALTDKGAELDQANDDPPWPDDAGVDAAALQSPTTSRLAPSKLRGGPGTMLELDGMKAVGQFEAAQPNVFLEPAQNLIRLMAQITETPLHAFDPSGDTPSGESLRVAEAPLVKKAINRERMLNSPIQETWKFVLKVREVPVTKIDVRFAPAQAATGKDDWETIGLKQAAGVPKDKTLIEAGYDAEEVATWDLTTPVQPTLNPGSIVPVPVSTTGN